MDSLTTTEKRIWLIGSPIFLVLFEVLMAIIGSNLNIENPLLGATIQWL